VTETAIRHAIRTGRLHPLERRGANRAFLFDVEDVRALGRSRRLGVYDRAYRHVAVVGVDENVVTALRVAGLHVEAGRTVMEAISTHRERYGPTILVASADLPETELVLLRVIAKDLHLILIGEAQWIDSSLLEQCDVCDPWDLRRLVRLALRLVEQRI
jgi:hypothetical protein